MLFIKNVYGKDINTDVKMILKSINLKTNDKISVSETTKI